LEVLVHGTGDSLGNAAVYLTFDDHGVKHGAAVVDDHVVLDLELTRTDPYADDPSVRSVRPTRSSVHEACVVG
jgi:hypothetical protein